MQASQTLADTVDMYFFDAGRLVPKTKSTVSKNEKQNPCVFLAESSISICNVICISTNTQCPKATRGWKNQGSIFQQESGPNQSRNSILSPMWEAQRSGLRSVALAMPGPHCPLPHTVLVTQGQGTGLPLPESQDRLLPGLLTFCDQRQGEQARIGTRRLSAFSEFQVCVRSRGTCMRPCTRSGGHTTDRRPDSEALNLAGYLK